MNKKIVKAMFSYAVSKDEIRPLMKGVHFAENCCVASDTHVLVVYKEVNGKLVGKTIQQDGTEIKGKYPDFKRVVPKKSGTPVAVNWKQVYEALKWFKRQPDFNVNDKVEIGGCHLAMCYLLNALEVFKAADDLGCMKGSTFTPDRPILLESEQLFAVIMPCLPEADKVDQLRQECESVIVSYENLILTHAIESHKPKEVKEEMAWL